MASLSRKLKRNNAKPVKLSEPQHHGKWMTNDEIMKLIDGTIQQTHNAAWATMIAASAYVLLYHWDELQDPNYRLRVFKDLLRVVTGVEEPTPKMKEAWRHLFIQTGLEVKEF